MVTKLGDFQDPHWVVPVAGTLRLLKGGIYRWSLRLEHISGLPFIRPRLD